MMRMTKQVLKIDLIGTEMKDGLLYISSPDLEGFHFLAASDEDLFETMGPTLHEFMRLYLKAEIGKISLAESPKQYRRKQLGIPAQTTSPFGCTMFAEVACELGRKGGNPRQIRHT